MRGLWLKERRIALREDLPDPVPARGEALIRPILVGICSTDLELLRGYSPFTGVVGHEFVGEVVAAPDDPRWEGARVVGEINASCDGCPTCRAGRPRHCEQRTVLGIVGRDGALAERLCLPLSNLHRVPETLCDEAAVFVEPLSAALRIQQQVHVQATDRVVLLGAGRLGQLIARTLALTGCALKVVARAHQLQLLSAAGIAASTAVPADHSADLVIDATGSLTGLPAALRLVRAGGTIVLKTTCVGETSLQLAQMVVDEVTVIGSRCGPFAPALRLLETGAVDPRPLITGRYSLEQGVQAFGAAAAPAALKVLIDPSA